MAIISHFLKLFNVWLRRRQWIPWFCTVSWDGHLAPTYDDRMAKVMGAVIAFSKHLACSLMLYPNSTRHSFVKLSCNMEPQTLPVTLTFC